MSTKREKAAAAEQDAAQAGASAGARARVVGRGQRMPEMADDGNTMLGDFEDHGEDVYF